MPQVYPGPNQKLKGPRWLLLVIAVIGVSLLGTIALLVLSSDGDDDAAPDNPDTVAQVPTDPDAEQDPPTEILTTETPLAGMPPAETPTVEQTPAITAPAEPATDVDDTALVMLDSDLASSLLQAPLAPAEDTGIDVERGQSEPFTIIPARDRTDFVQYTVVQGDTPQTVAERFNLEPESIAWSNPRSLMQRFWRPGDVVNIPPTNGVYLQTTGTTRTFRDYAIEYDIDDPYVILDSEYNPNLRQYQPDDVPPDGTPIFIPGGQAEEIVWVAAIEIIEESSGGSSGSVSGGGDSGGGAPAQPQVFRVTFQNGEPGSCPAQEAVGGTFWQNPLDPGYRITRGFTNLHPGIDLAASPGTPIKAANGGRVIFAGWNGFGYGYMVALIHGPTMTVYGHMQAYYVNCGQDVAAGQVIGEVGSSGNSSGPHLHFEIRSRSGNTYVPYNPASTIGF